MAKTIGVVTPAVTIFDDGHEIDLNASCVHLDYLIDGGVDALLLSGSCSEFFTLDGTERRRLIETELAHVAERVPAFVGVMHTSTREAQDLARFAQSAGASAVMSVPPYYCGGPEREVMQYFRDIAEVVDIPLIVYNNPALSGISMSVSTLAALTAEGTAGMIKESHGDPSRIHDLRSVVPDSVSIMYGEDYGAFEALMVGADGWFAGVSNTIPQHAAKLYELCRAGDVEAARAWWFKLLPFVNMTSFKPMYGRPDERPDFIQIFKAGLDAIGRRGGPCRRPLLGLPAEDLAYLRVLVDDLELTPANA